MAQPGCVLGLRSEALKHLLLLLEVAFVQLPNAAGPGARRLADFLDELKVLPLAVVGGHVCGDDAADFQFLLALATRAIVHFAEHALDLVDVRVLLELGFVEHRVRARTPNAFGRARLPVAIAACLRAHVQEPRSPSAVFGRSFACATDPRVVRAESRRAQVRGVLELSR